jgi:hypothetical protein
MRLMGAMMLLVMTAGCPGFCGDGPDNASTEASIYVTGYRGQNLDAAQFVENGNYLDSRCGERDAELKCIYDVVFLPPGAHSIRVLVPNYEPAMVSVDTTTNDSVHVAVSLQEMLKPDHVSDLTRE